MDRQVVGRKTGVGLTSIWKSNLDGFNIVESNPLYADMQPYKKENTAFLYSGNNRFIGAGNSFQGTKSDTRRHAVNYFMYMNQHEWTRFLNQVPIDFERAKTLEEEDNVQTDDKTLFVNLEKQSSSFLKAILPEERKLLVEIICLLKNGKGVKVICEKERERRLFELFIRLFSDYDIGLNVNLGEEEFFQIDIGINCKMFGVLVKDTSSVEISPELDFMFSHLERAKKFIEKEVEQWKGGEVFSVQHLEEMVKHYKEMKKWKIVGMDPMKWPEDMSCMKDVVYMQEQLMENYRSHMNEKRFRYVQTLYQEELKKMLAVRYVNPFLNAEYVASVLYVCFQLSPNAYGRAQMKQATLVPQIIDREAVRTFMMNSKMNIVMSYRVMKMLKRLLVRGV